MELRVLDLIVLSAENLKYVNHVSKMKAYVEVSLDGEPHSSQKFKSPVDRDGGTNPTWNFAVILYINESSAQQDGLNLHFKIRCDHALGDRDIGEVIVPVEELLESSSSANSERSTVTYPVCRPSGRLKGELHFSYKLSNRLTDDG